MTDREKVIKDFNHLLNAAKGNYQDFVDLTVDGGEEILALLKEQEEEIENLKQTAQSMMEGICLLKEQEAVNKNTGEWKNGHCSCCGEDVSSVLDTWTNVQNFLFCPYCGAKMEGR